MSSYVYIKDPIKYRKNSNFFYKEKEKLNSKLSKISANADRHSFIPLYYRVHLKKYLLYSGKYAIGGLGVLILLIALSPIAMFYLNQIFFNRFSQSFLSSVPSSQIQAATQSSGNPLNLTYNPDSQYFQNVVNAAKTTDNNKYQNYNGTFTLSISSIDLTNVKVKANVDSTSSSYLSILNNSTAQFKGTALPGEVGNVFIYGHSSVVWYHALFKDSYLGIFTDLTKVNIGDTIKINFMNQTYIYQVYRTEIVAPTALDELKPEGNDKILTLMTCVPPGIGTERLIIKAIQEN